MPHAEPIVAQDAAPHFFVAASRWHPISALFFAVALLVPAPAPFHGASAVWIAVLRYAMPMALLLLATSVYLSFLRQRRQHQALLAMAQSRDQLRNILAAVPVRIFWKDRNLCYLGCNALYASHEGIEHAESLVGKSDAHLQRIMGPESSLIHEQEVMDTGISNLYYDEKQTTPSGQATWLRSSHVALRNSRLEVIGVIGIQEDITHSKQVEERLRQLSVAVEQSPASVVITDLSGVIEYVNPRFTEVTGYSATDAIGQNPRILHSKLTPQATFDGLWSTLAKGQVWRGEFINQRKNGERYWEESQIVPVRSTTGAITHYVAVKTDISLRKQLEADGAAALERLQRIAHQVPGMVYQYRMRPDGGSCFPFVSEAIRGIYRLSPEDVREDATQLFANIHPEDLAEVVHTIQASATDLTPWRHEYRLRFDDGVERWLCGNALPQREADGGVLWHGFITDVTERKQLDSRSRQLALLDAQQQHAVSTDKLNYLALYDALTLLPNRRLLQERLQQALSGTDSGVLLGALLFVDLDDFKIVNEALGHNKGDCLLQQVAKQLLLCVRDKDTVARLGGDEFAVLLEGLSHDAQDASAQAQRVADKILQTINQTYQLGDSRHHCTASIGITLLDDSAKTSVDVSMQQAELALNQAKATGHNTLRCFDPLMQSIVSARASLEMGLRDALDKRQFQLLYQPQLNAAGQITGVEALVRWLDPVLGLVSPAEFIPLAEECGLIIPLGRWVLETACAQLKRWSAMPGFSALTVAVNVSARQFNQKDFCEQVRGVLALTGAKPQRLKLELTESLLVSNVEEVIAKMDELQSIGIEFSLDDFGTGFSSLSYLKRLPLSQLKIDQSFVKDIVVNSSDAALAKMVIALAGSLNLSVIAEGVETEAQRIFLEQLGCHAYQGYLFARPLDSAAVETYAHQHFAVTENF